MGSGERLLGGVRARFVIASAVLVLTTIASGAFGGFTLAYVSRVVDETVRTSAERNSLAAELSSTLEREDDAILVALNGDLERSTRELNAERVRFAKAFVRVRELTTSEEGKTLIDALAKAAEDYRVEGDALLARTNEITARDRYHERVNPVLRHAVSACTALRAHSFVRLQIVAEWARDRARTAVAGVAALVLGALILSAVVVLNLGRVVVWPIRELTSTVDRMRAGDFSRRMIVQRSFPDELARLVDGVNEMAKEVERFRRSNLDELLRTKRTLEATLASLPDAVLLIGADRRIVSANEAAIELLGHGARPGAILDDAHLPKELAARVDDALAGETSEQPDPLAAAFTLGGRRMLARAVATEGLESRQTVVALHDVTEFARLDEMRAELVAVAAHELRTPLTTLRMMLLLLAERNIAKDASATEMVNGALSACDALGSTVDEFLDLARIEAGKLRLALERLDVHAPLDEAIAALRPQFDDANLAIELTRNGPGMVSADRARLRCVFTNLMANALKYAPRGSRVSVSLGRAGVSGIEVAVEDQGPGVPEELRGRVFEKFFRVEHHRPGADSVHGTGVGLYLVREIVAAHGGSVRCEAGQSARGARFVVTLPVDATDA